MSLALSDTERNEMVIGLFECVMNLETETIMLERIINELWPTKTFLFEI